MAGTTFEIKSREEIKGIKSHDTEPLFTKPFNFYVIFESFVDIQSQKLSFFLVFCLTNTGFLLCKTGTFAHPAFESYLSP